MIKLISVVLFVITGFACFSQTTYIHCGKLINGITPDPLLEMTIVTEGDKIINISKGYTAVPTGSKLIDLKNRTVMPGLIDAHVHISGETSRNRYTEDFVLNPEDFAFRAVGYAERTLFARFTTVRDLGGTTTLALRNAINSGYIKGPRIIAAGKSIATTGGHADPTNGMNREFMNDPEAKDGVINGADEAVKAVRQRYKEGSDVIKITATGGVLSNAKDGAGAHFSEAEINAVVAYYPPVVTIKALETGPRIQATFAKAFKAGVKIAFGTDAGVFMHGKNFREFEYMTEAGMPPMIAIQSATVAGADLLGMSDKIGSIEKGKLADIIAVDGDPIKDIKVMKEVRFVMKEGIVYKQ